MELDIRENYIATQYNNILMVINETPRKYFIRVAEGYDFVPHIKFRFKNLSTGINRWFVVPITTNFGFTVMHVLRDLQKYYCDKHIMYSFINEYIYTRLENGEFDSILNCETIKGILYNLEKNKDDINLQYRYPSF